MEEIKSDNSVFERMLSGMTLSGPYSHLKIILSRVIGNPKLGQKYLMVSSSSFGVVILNDIDFMEDKIILHVKDTFYVMEQQFELDVNETGFKFLLISWNDIKSLVRSDNDITASEDETLVELER